MPTPGVSEGPVFERLESEESWQLLATRAFGRVCLSVDDRVEIILAAYVPRADAVYFRATAFGAVARQVESRPVTLQVDDMPEAGQAGWSVTLTGAAHRVGDAATLAALWSPVRPHAWSTGIEGLWIALVPDDVQGQRLRART